MSAALIPARKNPLTYAGLALALVSLGYAWRRGGLLGLVVGIFGGLWMYGLVTRIAQNAPTADVLGVGGASS